MKMTRWNMLGMSIVIGLASLAQADTYVWTQTNRGVFAWSDSANWLNSTPPPFGGSSNATIQFFTNATPFGVGFFQVADNDLGEFTLNAFTLNSRNNSATNILTGGAFRFVADGAAMPRITIDANGMNTRPITISNNFVLTGSPLTFYFPQSQNSALTYFRGDSSGTGNVVQATGGLYSYFGGVKTFTGDLVVSNKLLYIEGTNAFTGNLVVKNGANAYLRGPNDANDFNGVAIVEPGGALQVWPGTQIGVWNNNVTNNGSLSYYYSGASGVCSFNGVIYGSGTNSMAPAAGGTLYLTNSLNPFTGKTDVQSQILVINTIGNINGGPTSIGNPDSTANGTINLGLSTGIGTLKYIGAAGSSDRRFNLSGTTGGGVIDASGSGPLALSGDITATGAGSKTLTLQGANAESNTLSGVIQNNSAANKTGVIKLGTGMWVLRGTNTYSGATTVSDGILVLLGDQSSATGNTVVSGGILRINSAADLGPGNLSMNGGILESAGNVALPGGVASGQMQIPGGVSGFSARGGDIEVAFGTLGSPDTLAWGTAPFIPSTFILNGVTADGKLVFRSPINLNSTAGAKTNTLQVSAASAELVGGLTQSGAGSTILNKTGNGLLVLPTNSTTAASLSVAGGGLRISSSNSLPGGLLTLSSGTLLDCRNDVGTLYLGTAGPHPVAFTGTGTYTVNVDRAVGGSGVNQVHALGDLGTIPGGNILAVTGANGYGLRLGSVTFSSIASAASAGSILNQAPGQLTVTGGVTTAQSSNHGWLTLGGSGDMEIQGSILGAMGAPTTGLTKNDSGLVILSGSNRFGAAGNAITVNGGTLRVNHPSGLPSFSGVVSNALRVTGGTLDINGYSYTVSGVSFGSAGTASGATGTLASGAGTVTLIGNISFTNNAAGDSSSLISGNLSLNNAARTFTVHDAPAVPYDMTVSANMGGGGAGGALTKAGLGTLRLSGSNSFTGATLINAGTLALDYTDNTNNKIAPGVALTIGLQGFPASLQILGTPPGALSINGLTISGNSNSLVLAAPTVLNAGIINRSLGADPLAITVSGGGTLATTAGGTPGGILTNYGGIVIGTYNGIDDWAALDADGVTITGLSAVGGYTAMGAYVAGRNADITGDVTPTANATFNSLRFNTAAACTLSLSGVNTIPTGGILVTPAVGSNRTIITGGSLRPNSNTGGREFAILQNNPDGELLVGTILTNNSGNAYVTKSGPGRLVITANNSVGGSTFLNAGELQYGDGSTTGALTQFGYLYAQNGTVIRVAGTNLVVSTVTGILPFGNPVIDVAAGCVLENGTMNSGGNGSWVKTGPGTLRQLNSGFTAGWVKEGVFLSDAGANYTLNGGAVIGATNAGAPPALVKILGTRDPIIGNSGGVINRTGTLDINGKVQTVANLTFTGGGVVTNSDSPAKLRLANVVYNAAPGVGETAVVTMDVEGSSSRNDFQALQLTINDDPNLDRELAIYGGVSNYPGMGSWGMQKMGSGTLYFGGTNTWGGIAQILSGILIANKPASLPGFATINRWPVSAGATLAVCAGGPDEWTAADIDTLRAVSPSHFAANSWLGIDTTAGEFTYGSVIGNGAGVLGFRKLGTNRLVLAAANTFTGNTVVHAGTLVASNANALGTSGTITVNSNATFAVGAGITFSRPVTFNPGSTLAGQGTFYANVAWSCPAGFTVAPGLPAGTLTVDRSLALAAGNTLRIAFQPDGSYGELAVNGTLDISEPTARLVLTGKPAPGRHVLAEGTAVTGQFQDANVDLTGFTGAARITYTATQVVLNVDATGTLIWIR